MANPPFFQIFKGDHLITSSISLNSNEVEQWNKFPSWSLDKIAVRLVTGQKLASCGSLMATTVDHSSNGGSRKSYHLVTVTTSSRWCEKMCPQQPSLSDYPLYSPSADPEDPKSPNFDGETQPSQPFFSRPKPPGVDTQTLANLQRTHDFSKINWILTEFVYPLVMSK